ncbi:MAG: hypothetical protein KAU48_01850, partial [Candidatus Thorarchaeota archaeon]|nr:hypothetical protein [Candidatus Thorarchaeota archaeon]
MPETYTILDIESRMLFGSCFIKAALLVPKDWKVLWPLHQAFSVSVQLAATVKYFRNLVLVSEFLHS